MIFSKKNFKTLQRENLEMANGYIELLSLSERLRATNIAMVREIERLLDSVKIKPGENNIVDGLARRLSINYSEEGWRQNLNRNEEA